MKIIFIKCFQGTVKYRSSGYVRLVNEIIVWYRCTAITKIIDVCDFEVKSLRHLQLLLKNSLCFFEVVGNYFMTAIIGYVVVDSVSHLSHLKSKYQSAIRVTPKTSHSRRNAIWLTLGLNLSSNEYSVANPIAHSSINITLISITISGWQVIYPPSVGHDIL